MADTEIDAMVAVSSAFDELDEHARGRVLRWAADKYGVSVPATKPTGHDRRGALDDEAAEDDLVEPGAQVEDSSPPPAVYDHFAELYDAASPGTKDEKVLVAGYWFQKIQGSASFQSYELNRELRDLGHRVDHISDALGAGIRKKPALVLQLKKAGNTAQARKTYKLSAEGLKTVERMIAGSDR